jgi:hypothetical protein
MEISNLKKTPRSFLDLAILGFLAHSDFPIKTLYLSRETISFPFSFPEISSFHTIHAK